MFFWGGANKSQATSQIMSKAKLKKDEGRSGRPTNMMKMNKPKLEPTKAQMKMQKNLHVLCLFTFVHTSWHLRLCTWHPR